MFLDQKTSCLYWINGDDGETEYDWPLDWVSSEAVMPFLATLEGSDGRSFNVSRNPLHLSDQLYTDTEVRMGVCVGGGGARVP